MAERGCHVKCDVLTQEFLEREHYALRKPTEQIGLEVGCSGRYVRYRMKAFGLLPLGDVLKKGKQCSPETQFGGPRGPVGTEGRFKKGQPAHNKGVKGPRGADHWNWRGGTSRDRRMGDPDYRDWRKAVFERDDYTCQMCGVHGGRLNADHIQTWRDHPDLRYDLANGRTLCVECHRTTPTYGGRARRAVA